MSTDTDTDAGAGRPKNDEETRGTVLIALLANVAIAVAKAVVGAITASPALLAEAAHSVADTLNEVFLLVSVRASRRSPDAQHPFGYGKERYFWALLAAVGIFVTGGCFSFYQGLHGWLSPESGGSERFLATYVVLAVSLVAESTSLLRAVVQLRGQARSHGHSLLREITGSVDPTVRTVFAEDATAVLGVLLAAGGVLGHQLTGSPRWEAAAALAIALLLVLVAYWLGRSARDLLVGQAVDPRLQQEAYELLAAQPEIDTVAVLQTMRLGVDSALLAARVDLREGMDSEEVEEVSERIKRELRERFPELAEVFLDIVDADHQDRERARVRREEVDRAVAQQASQDEPPRR
ncbi:cation diffusion facilitator family transporter [Actinacidiphila paucisporea]|uniref:Cation diffusion facilitator family transporter n=1 Tax=Actinacidiphila paucisporea TaxID=310782 RepID=A0A1M7FZX6_9ACTN|nr:cation diffusion facilitator family transporter [Actinacidiphila paucisporea]SHM09540.1 cation diffusion facilitator family transporter [Actinacidiphila paucisporea]